ncbi:hypothetical protein EG68_11050, partial [Paragonimus skrjabini miyazakii]
MECFHFRVLSSFLLSCDHGNPDVPSNCDHITPLAPVYDLCIALLKFHIIVMTGYGDAVLSVGTNVDIQRTDGRVHSAIVSGINPNTKSVTVEWYEKGEAKGKEIELEAIFQLNPNLRKPGPSPDTISGTGDSTVLQGRKEPPSALQRPVVTASIAPPGDGRGLPSANNGAYPSNQFEPPSFPAPSRLVAPSTRVPAQPRSTSHVPSRPTVDDRANPTRVAVTASTNDVTIVRSQQDASAHSYVSHYARGVPPNEEPQSIDPAHYVTSHEGDSEGLSHLIDLTRDPENGSFYADDGWIDQEGGDGADDGSMALSSNARALASDGQRRQLGRANTTAASSAPNTTNTGGSGTMRKSNCVKEIERIQQRREERRAAQRAVRDQVELDPSNPSYEFHMMINEYRSTLDYRPL